MSPAVVELHVGGRVWFEGSMYLVQELGPQRTTLTADGRLRSVATADVVRHATLFSDDTETDDQITQGEARQRPTLRPDQEPASHARGAGRVGAGRTEPRSGGRAVREATLRRSRGRAQCVQPHRPAVDLRLPQSRSGWPRGQSDAQPVRPIRRSSVGRGVPGGTRGTDALPLSSSNHPTTPEREHAAHA